VVRLQPTPNGHRVVAAIPKHAVRPLPRGGCERLIAKWTDVYRSNFGPEARRIEARKRSFECRCAAIEPADFCFPGDRHETIMVDTFGSGLTNNHNRDLEISAHSRMTTAYARTDRLEPLE